jgi:nucleotide-binding universal stress UspA family protein
MILDPGLEDEIEEQERIESDAELRALDDVLGIRARPMIEVGEAGPTICRIAGAVGADVVVVGSHGHGWLQRVFLGSVSRHVLGHAPCPVLVVRLPEAEPALGDG